jgi:hypothetical protein
MVWVEAGRPQSGELFIKKCRLRRDVRKWVRFCVGKAETLKIRKRDQIFAGGHKGRFRALRKKRDAYYG